MSVVFVTGIRRSRPALRRARLERVVAVFVLLVASCDPGPSPSNAGSSTPDLPGGRVFVDPGWEEIWSVGTEDDTLLALPALLTPAPDGFHLFDDADGRVRSFDRNGRLRWSWGRRGEGPEEFGRASAMRVDAGGRLHVLDETNRKVVELSPDGRVLGIHPLPSGAWRSFTLLGDGRYLLGSADGDFPFGVTHRTGGPLLDSLAFPWSGYGDLSRLQRQGWIFAAEPGDDRWAYAFALSNGWFAFRGARPMGYTGRSVESVPVPEVRRSGERSGEGRTRRESLAGRPVPSALGGWISGDTVHIHFGGTGADRHAVIDRYDFETGAYLNSLRLPEPVGEVARLGEQYLFLTLNPYPRVRAYRIAGPDGVASARRRP